MVISRIKPAKAHNKFVIITKINMALDLLYV